jgi:hypothetical protein
MKRIRRVASLAVAVVLVLVVLYGLLLAFPEPLFAHRIEQGPFIIYSREEVHRELLAPRIQEAQRRLERSEIHRSGAKHRVFVTGSKSLHRLFNGPYFTAIARNTEVGNAIFLPRLDPDGARVVHFDGRSAPLEEILAHEAIHTFVQERLGFVRAIRLPFWKKEGYAQYLGMDFFPLEVGGQSLASPERNPRLPGGNPVPRPYFEAALVWAHRMQVEKESFDEVMARREPFSDLLEEALAAAESIASDGQ